VERKTCRSITNGSTKTKISILDEPDSGLDIDAVQAVAKAIKSSCR